MFQRLRNTLVTLLTFSLFANIHASPLLESRALSPAPLLSRALVPVRVASECVQWYINGLATDSQVCATISGQFMIVTFYPTAGYSFRDAHVWVGVGTPPSSAYETFPYTVANNACSLTGDKAICKVPLSSFENVCGVTPWAIAAHATVHSNGETDPTKTESGWGTGDCIHPGCIPFATSWPFYIVCEERAVSTKRCSGTGYGYVEGMVEPFGDRGKWGWTIVTRGYKSGDIYAGAGRNDLSKATRVGSLGIGLDSTTLTITYTLDPGNDLGTTHLYIGTVRPTTTAPGRLGFKQENPGTDDTVNVYTFTPTSKDSNGDIMTHLNVRKHFTWMYIVAHAEVTWAC